MSLMQHGSQTETKRIRKIPAIIRGVISAAVFIMIWADDAHVLIRTCAACGNFVLGIKHAMITPRIAAGFTMYHSSMNPRCRPWVGESSCIADSLS